MFRRKKSKKKLTAKRSNRKVVAYLNPDRTVNEPSSIYEDNAEIVERALRAGTDPNFIKNGTSLPALSSAVADKHSEVIDIFGKFLSDSRTDVNKTDEYGWTPLMYACYDRVSDKIGVELVSLLLKHSQIAINKKNNGGCTALHWACEFGRSRCVKKLIDDDRTDVNITDHAGKTPLYIAVFWGKLQTVKVLLSSPSTNPNILSNGETPLHYAQEVGDNAIIKELLKDERTDPNIAERIDPNIADQDGMTVAEQITDPELLEYLPVPVFYEDIYYI